MSARGGVVLANNVDFVGSSAAGSGSQVQWIGGRTALTVNGQAYGGLVLQCQGIAPLASWIPVCSSIVADGVFSFDLPPGQFQLVNQTSSAIGICAALTGVSIK